MPESSSEGAPRGHDADAAFPKVLEATFALKGDLRSGNCTRRQDFRNLIDLSAQSTLRSGVLFREVNGGASARVLMAPRDVRVAIFVARTPGGELRMGTDSLARRHRSAVRQFTESRN